MVSDRGTLPRGAVADQQASWAEPTAPGGRRMPSAPRERKPALAALAVLLVALGAVAAGYLVINAGHRVGAVEITQEVGQGQRIPASAIKEVEIASNTGINYVAWQYANRVAGVYAAVQIPAGTLLTPAMTTATNNLAAGKVQVGLSLKPGQAPANLLIGQAVEAFGVGTGSGCTGGTGGAGGGGTAGTRPAPACPSRPARSPACPAPPRPTVPPPRSPSRSLPPMRAYWPATPRPVTSPSR